MKLDIMPRVFEVDEGFNVSFSARNTADELTWGRLDDAGVFVPCRLINQQGNRDSKPPTYELFIPPVRDWGWRWRMGVKLLAGWPLGRIRRSFKES